MVGQPRRGHFEVQPESLGIRRSGQHAAGRENELEANPEGQSQTVAFIHEIKSF
jgi:hypothetical protein